jgi:ketosteroid isomerase-like protein
VVAGAAELTTPSRRRIDDWIGRYEQAWRTAGTDALHELFTDDATYSMSPYAEPFRGLDAIAIMWDAEREGPDEVFTMSSEIVACEGPTCVVRVEVHYERIPREEFKDLWVVRFSDDDRCEHFEEWPFWPAKA